MEFDEMKKIWDAQNNEPLYTFDEKALHNRIRSKMNTMLRFTSITEWVLILINVATAGILLGFNGSKPGTNTFLYLEAAWMFVLAVYLVSHHIHSWRSRSFHFHCQLPDAPFPDRSLEFSAHGSDYDLQWMGSRKIT
jgi:hypothetical protein